NTWVGTLAYLLPYYEQDNIYRQLQIDWNVQAPVNQGVAPLGTAWWFTPANFQLAQSRISLFLCPSDDMGDATPVFNVYCSFYSSPPAYTWFGVRYASEGGAQGPSIVFGRTNYLACQGTIGDFPASISPFYAQYKGLFMSRSSVRFEQVGDGTSN